MKKNIADSSQTKKLNRYILQKNSIKNSINARDALAESIGTVMAFFGKEVDIVTCDRQIIRCSVRRNIPDIVVGDRVIWECDDHICVITARIERKNSFTIHHKRITQGGIERKAIYSKKLEGIAIESLDGRKLTKDIAANIDQIVVSIASIPTPSLELLDRFLVNAWQNNIEAIIVVNKKDINCNQSRESMEHILDIYRNMYSCLYVSAKTGENIDKLARHLKHKTTLMVGQSGVGKSSILSSLCPSLDISIGNLTNSGVGRHTTSIARLFHLKDLGENSWLIDCPGVRQLAILPMETKNLEQAFADIMSLSKDCNFISCSHDKEKGCAVIKSIKEGILANSRLDSFHEINKEMKSRFF